MRRVGSDPPDCVVPSTTTASDVDASAARSGAPTSFAPAGGPGMLGTGAPEAVGSKAIPPFDITWSLPPGWPRPPDAEDTPPVSAISVVGRAVAADVVPTALVPVLGEPPAQFAAPPAPPAGPRGSLLLAPVVELTPLPVPGAPVPLPGRPEPPPPHALRPIPRTPISAHSRFHANRFHGCARMIPSPQTHGPIEQSRDHRETSLR